jgi:hypothetical protein
MKAKALFIHDIIFARSQQAQNGQEGNLVIKIKQIFLE